MPVRRATSSTLDNHIASVEPLDVPWLRALLRHAVRCSLASSLTLGACGGDSDHAQKTPQHRPATHEPVADAGSDGGMMTSVMNRRPQLDSGLGTDADLGIDAGTSQSKLPLVGTCDPPATWHLVDGFSLARDVDYIADRFAPNSNSILSERGDACASASKRDACEASLALGPSGRHLVTIEGDAVRFWQGVPALELLGEIDTPEEAIWWLDADGYVVDCKAAIDQPDIRYRIHVKHTTSDACGTVTESRELDALVGPRGSIQETQVVMGMSSPQGCAIGRRPEGLRSEHHARGQSPLGEHFATMAHLEAASVPAFAAIAGELRAYRAPSVLIRAAERARRDEVRHARITARLARRFGARAQAPRVAPMPLRTLEAFALDNAVEGCVNETYGAALATYGAAQAGDSVVRRALAGIAADETRHAELAWAIARWITPQLGRAARARIRKAQQIAVTSLARTLDTPVDRALRELAGVPHPAAARALHTHLASTLWRA